jgi:hypothetical protein
MVPMDQPKVALKMLDRFFGNWHLNRMAKMAAKEKGYKVYPENKYEEPVREYL